MGASQVMIRFRDLTVELGGTIRDHQELIRRFGEVWWGWFMQPYETVPRTLFAGIRNGLDKTGTTDALLFDTGQGLFYRTVISDVKVAPSERGLSSPDPERSPEYYHRGRYSAWFKLLNIQAVRFDELHLRYLEFPTRPDRAGTLNQLVGNSIREVDNLRETKVTLWVVTLGT